MDKTWTKTNGNIINHPNLHNKKLKLHQRKPDSGKIYYTPINCLSIAQQRIDLAKLRIGHNE